VTSPRVAVSSGGTESPFVHGARFKPRLQPLSLRIPTGMDGGGA
jgi:hypothetical protein